MLVPVYDIRNCGPRHRFVANGKLVHNSDKFNLQNVPRGSAIRKAIKAPPGYVIIDADSSQIELRIVAWLAGETELLNLFRKNDAELLAGVPKDKTKYDPYRNMASKIYGVPDSEIDAAQRFVGKTTLLAAIYMTSGAKLFATLKAAGTAVTEAEARGIITTFRTVYPGIVALWRRGENVLRALASISTTEFGAGWAKDAIQLRPGYIELPNGLTMTYQNLREEQNGWVYDIPRGSSVVKTNIYGGKVVENFTQALARTVVGEQMLLVRKRYRPIMTVHDAVAVLAKEEEAAEARRYVEQCMRTVPDWAPGLPLNCESKVGATYGG